MNKDNKLKPFITIPRSIANDFKAGAMTFNELVLYLWMRINADPYGKYTASIPALKDDIFKGVSENYVNKLLLSLRSKKYLHFPHRQGRRGSFIVSFPDFITPESKITTLDKFTPPEATPIQDISKAPSSSEGSQNPTTQSQNFQEAKNRLGKALSFDSPAPQIRTHYNDNENENEN